MSEVVITVQVNDKVRKLGTTADFVNPDELAEEVGTVISLLAVQDQIERYGALWDADEEIDQYQSNGHHLYIGDR